MGMSTTPSGDNRVFWWLSLDQWNGLIVAFGLISGVFVLLTGGATGVSLWLQKAETIAIKTQLAEADAAAARANEAAGEANKWAASLEKEASNARLETERLKEQLAWRELHAATIKRLATALSEHVGSVNLWYTDGDAEALALAAQISSALKQANWQYLPSGVRFDNTIVFGIRIPDSISEDTKALRKAFDSAKIPFDPGPLPTPAVQLNFRINPSAPTLVIGSKPRPQL